MGSPVKAREWEKTLKVKCRLCGGIRCKRCSESAALAKQDSPVKGLHADWVVDCALAMMRPSSRLMNEYKIAEQFHKLNITAVFNLTLPGEHPYCGDGLGTSGFPYDPEKDLMAENIRFYNFGWEDMTTPTLSFMMDIVKVIASVLLTGHHKVAVHCHAGYGRTGITIACALIFLHNIPPELAIRLVRRDRPGSVQTAGQVQFVHDFHAYLNAARVVFALPKIHDRFTLAETVEHQNRRLHGEGAVNSSLPRVLDFLCVQLEGVVSASSDVMAVASAFVNHLCVRQQEAWPRTIECTKEFYCPTSSDNAELLDRHRQFIGGAVNESLKDSDSISFDAIEAPEPTTREQLFPIKVGFNVGEWNWEEASALCPNASTRAVLLLDWLEHLREPLLNSPLVEKLLHVSPVPPLKLPTTAYGHAGLIHHTRSESETQGNSINSSYQFQGLHQLPAYAMRSLDRILSCLRVLEAKLKQFATGDVLFDAVCARTAMALFHLSPTSCTTSSLRRHTDCVALLVDKWHAPKRLELNLESLQKLSVHRPSSCRLTQSASTINYSSELGVEANKPHLTARSATRTPREPNGNLPGTLSDDMADSLLPPQTVTTEPLGTYSPQQPHKPHGEALPRPSISCGVITSSPRPSPRSSSPIKIDPILASLRREEDGKPLCLSLPSTPKKMDLSPLAPQLLPEKESELSDDSFGMTFSAEFTGTSLQMDPPALPSVRDGGRYSRRAGNTVK
ncbi:tyrosine phosphatase domain-containing protein 1 protein [Phytophthora nicotianae]|uniref:Tyrosine phosphatase domain-containing protein 1 protein n=1 Tax=Phytophthora nicotianae TaxID=4792 RepID=A0A0W8D2K7_PHYNI|nr:tyrosine phosphatase domain-containing protein 1 protein [Phytophthora nicotianae]